MKSQAKPDEDEEPEVTIPPVNTCLMVIAVLFLGLISLVMTLVAAEVASEGGMSKAGGLLLTALLLMGGIGALATELGAKIHFGPEGVSRRLLGKTYGRIPWSKIDAVQTMHLTYRGTPYFCLMVTGDLGFFGLQRTMKIQEHGRTLQLKEAEHVARHYLKRKADGDAFEIRRG